MKTMVTIAEVKIWPFHAYAVKTTQYNPCSCMAKSPKRQHFIRNRSHGDDSDVRFYENWLWDRYNVPQIVFLVLSGFWLRPYSIVMGVSVCLSVCHCLYACLYVGPMSVFLSACISQEQHMSKLHRIFCARCLWPWLGHPLRRYCDMLCASAFADDVIL